MNSTLNPWKWFVQRFMRVVVARLSLEQRRRLPAGQGRAHARPDGSVWPQNDRWEAKTVVFDREMFLNALQWSSLPDG
jgi:hypothetical protein